VVNAETKITRRTSAIDASAHPTAATPTMSRIVRTDMETSTSERRVRVGAGDGSATVIYPPSSPRGG
jgi:hypothetical protein